MIGLVDLKSAHLQGTVGELKDAACEVLGLTAEDTQIWDYYQGSYYSEKPLDDIDGGLEAPFQNSNLVDNQDLILLEKVSLHFLSTPPRSPINMFT